MTTVKTKFGEMQVNDPFSADASEPPPPRPANRVAGEVEFQDHQGRTIRLRPDFEAALAIEDKLGGLDGVRVRLASSGLPGMGSVTYRELGVIIAAGVRSAGESRVSDDKAAKFAFDCGRDRLRKPLSEFLRALIDGGQLRADDLGNGASPSASLGGSDGAESLMQEMASRSDGSSA